MARGGKREGAGRKKGVKIGHIKPQTVCYHRRILPEFVELMDKYLSELKATKNPSISEGLCYQMKRNYEFMKLY